jgi:hypothetical protein
MFDEIIKLDGLEKYLFRRKLPQYGFGGGKNKGEFPGLIIPSGGFGLGGNSIFPNPGPVFPSDVYVTEDGKTYYVAEDGSTYYVQEDLGSIVLSVSVGAFYASVNISTFAGATSYDLAYNTSNTVVGATTVIGFTSGSAVGPLSPNTTYYFFSRANNSTGSSGWSTPSISATTTSPSIWAKADTGVITNGASLFVRSVGTPQYFTVPDTQAIRGGARSFTFGCWVNLSVNNFDGGIIGKIAANALSGYLLSVVGSSGKLQFYLASGSAGQAVVWGTATSLSTWYFVVARYDSVAQTISINVNNGTPVSASYTIGSADSGTVMGIGAWSTGIHPSGSSIGPAFFYVGVLSSANETSLYNSGSGLYYSQLPSSLSTDLNLKFYTDLAIHEAGDNLTDYVSGLTLTNIHSVAPTTFVGSGQASDGDSAYLWNDQSINGNNLTQSTATKFPQYKANLQNGLPMVRFDGVDDLLASVSTINFTDPTWILMAVIPRSFAANGVLCDGSNGSSPFHQAFFEGAGLLQLENSAAGPSQSGMTAGSAYIVEGIFNGASSILNVNNGTDQTGNAGTGNATQNFTLGAQAGGSPNPSQIDVGEVIVFPNYSPSANDRLYAKQYLDSRWNAY